MLLMVALLPLQAASWMPVWMTPLWILGVGLVVGLVASALLLLLFGLLSRLPLVGTLADSPRRANLVAGVLAFLVAGGLLAVYYPQVEPGYRNLLILPACFASMIFAWGVIYGSWHRTFGELREILGKGAIGWLLSVTAIAGLSCLALMPLAEDTRGVLTSLAKVNWLDRGERESVLAVEGVPAEIDPDDAPLKQFFLDYDISGVEQISIQSDRKVLIADAGSAEQFSLPPMTLEADTPLRWKNTDIERPPLPLDSRTGVWIQNREIDPATIRITIQSSPPFTQANTIVVTAISVVLFILAAIAFHQAFPRISAISWATAKEEMSQPLYLLLLGGGLVLILILVIMPFSTLGEDIKLFKDSGITCIMIFSLFQAIWSAGTSVSGEIEGRTAVTVLSKPISRRSFLIGKYVGIMLGVLVLFVVLGLWLMFWTSYKPIFEARENALETPSWQLAHQEMMSIVPGLVLYFMEAMAIGAIGVALATRLELLANLVICASIYVVGHLTSLIVESSSGQNELVGFVGKLIAVVVPNLNTFNVQAAVDVGNSIPPIYLAGALNYLSCFIVLAFAAALLLFEDRDLA